MTLGKIETTILEKGKEYTIKSELESGYKFGWPEGDPRNLKQALEKMQASLYLLEHHLQGVQAHTNTISQDLTNLKQIFKQL